MNEYDKKWTENKASKVVGDYLTCFEKAREDMSREQAHDLSMLFVQMVSGSVSYPIMSQPEEIRPAHGFVEFFSGKNK